MAVVQGQAVRRRGGVAPNSLVMAERGNAEGEQEEERMQCPVARCPVSRPVSQARSMDLHLSLDHPRHREAGPARDRLTQAMWPSAQTY